MEVCACGGLNRFDTMDSCVSILAIGSGSNRRYGLVRVGVALLEKVHHCGGGL